MAVIGADILLGIFDRKCIGCGATLSSEDDDWCPDCQEAKKRREESRDDDD